jgi:hypothetical protein
MSTRKIEAHLREHCGVSAGCDLISRVTDAVMVDARAWLTRPLDDGELRVSYDSAGETFVVSAGPRTDPLQRVRVSASAAPAARFVVSERVFRANHVSWRAAVRLRHHTNAGVGHGS